jgi:hypothetical protein
MRYLKLIILVLILLNIPSFALKNVDALAGTILSYGTFILIIVYFFFNKKEKPIVSLIVLGFLYFLISVIVNSQNSDNFFVIFVKYFIIIMATNLIKDTKEIEIYILLLIGALSVLYESIFIIDIGGRYSGFFLNPNIAGFICILGYCFSLIIDINKLRLFGQIVFTIAGLVTFSRTFLLLWILINVISLLINKKNIYKIFIAILLLSLFLKFGDKFDFDIKRLEAFTTFFDGKINDNMEEDSRTETWALYYDKIIDSPFFGNGYMTFSGKSYGYGEYASYQVGVHNTFLLILGEAGLFVFIYFVWIYFGFMVRGYNLFKEKPSVFLISLVLILFLFTNHNFFDNYILLFFSMWLFFQINIFKIKNSKIYNIKFKKKLIS